ncbi:MAG: flagellar hook basal-body protein [Gemmataceae bacterium]|nr:flagellar hook basal-body protein [Gemmataceae bacterium]
MIRGLYAAASGLQVASEEQEVTAYNLAKMSAPGYRQRGVVFETFDRVLGRVAEPTGDILGARAAGAFNDFRPGPLQLTDNPFDLALSETDQFFTVRGPNGPLYTRNGQFRITAEGRVVSPGGYPLLGEEGPVEVPPETRRVDVGVDGTVSADGQPVGRIRPARFADLRQLTAAGPTLYTAPPGVRPQETDGRVLQGYLERSNVEPADAMVRMIFGARFYDAAQRSLRTISESIQLDTRPQT